MVLSPLFVEPACMITNPLICFIFAFRVSVNVVVIQISKWLLSTKVSQTSSIREETVELLKESEVHLAN